MKIQIAERPDKTGSDYRIAMERLGVPYIADLTDDYGADALLLPGGGDLDPFFYGEERAGSMPPDRELDEKQLQLFDRFVSSSRPVFGICRGCQLINVALGGSLVQHLQTNMDHRRPASGGENLHTVKASKGSLVYGLYGESFLVNSSHHQACKKLGKGLIATVFAQDGTVEAIEHESLPVFAVQWHPERLGAELREKGCVLGDEILRYFLSLL